MRATARLAVARSRWSLRFAKKLTIFEVDSIDCLSSAQNSRVDKGWGLCQSVRFRAKMSERSAHFRGIHASPPFYPSSSRGGQNGWSGDFTQSVRIACRPLQARLKCGVWRIGARSREHSSFTVFLHSSLTLRVAMATPPPIRFTSCHSCTKTGRQTH